MAAFDLTLIEEESLGPNALTIDIPFVTGHSVGDIIEADGTVSSAIGDVIMGVCVRAGSAAGNKTRVLIEGPVTTTSAHGLAAGGIIYVGANNAASDAEPAGGAGTRITELGFAITTTRAYIRVTSYEKGA